MTLHLMIIRKSTGTADAPIQLYFAGLEGIKSLTVLKVMSVGAELDSELLLAR